MVSIGFKKTKTGMRYYRVGKGASIFDQTLKPISKKKVEELRKKGQVTEFFNINRFKQ